MPKLQLGALDEDNNYTPPSNANKYKSYKCCDCNNRVIFRSGTKRRAHFSHYSQTNTCTYYDHPNEAQIHKDAKYLLKKLLEGKKIIQLYWLCSFCKYNEPYIFQDTCSFTYLDGDKVHLEYKDKDGKWIADVAIVNNGNVRYIFEIKNTHKTITYRPEPWYEIDASSFIEIVNDTNAQTLNDSLKLNETIDPEYRIPCIRNIDRRCYGSFCYKEKWVKNIPGFDTTQEDNSCLLCNKKEYEGISDGCTGKFQNGEIRVCWDCIEEDIYKKRIREKYSKISNTNFKFLDE